MERCGPIPSQVDSEVWKWSSASRLGLSSVPRYILRLRFSRPCAKNVEPLPLHVRQSQTQAYSSFRRHLKTHYFQSAYMQAQRLNPLLISSNSPNDILTTVQCESKKSPLGDLRFFHFFHKRLRICNRFFTHLLYDHFYTRVQIFIQLSPILTKLCHIKRDYAVHIICAKCPKRTKTRTFRRLRKSLIALLIVVCGKSL